jgi:hypothetical protein
MARRNPMPPSAEYVSYCAARCLALARLLDDVTAEEFSMHAGQRDHLQRSLARLLADELEELTKEAQRLERSPAGADDRLARRAVATAKPAVA